MARPGTIPVAVPLQDPEAGLHQEPATALEIDKLKLSMIDTQPRHIAGGGVRGQRHHVTRHVEHIVVDRQLTTGRIDDLHRRHRTPLQPRPSDRVAVLEGERAARHQRAGSHPTDSARHRGE